MNALTPTRQRLTERTADALFAQLGYDAFDQVMKALRNDEDAYATCLRITARADKQMKRLPDMGYVQTVDYNRHRIEEYIVSVDETTVAETAAALGIKANTAGTHFNKLVTLKMIRPQIVARRPDQKQIYRATDKLVAEVAARS